MIQTKIKCLLFWRAAVLHFVSISLVLRSFSLKPFSKACRDGTRRNLRFSYNFLTSRSELSRKPIYCMTCNDRNPKISPCHLLQCGASTKSTLLFTVSHSLAGIQLQNWSLQWLKEKWGKAVSFLLEKQRVPYWILSSLISLHKVFHLIVLDGWRKTCTSWNASSLLNNSTSSFLIL